MWPTMPGYLMALDRPDDDFEAGDARLERSIFGPADRVATTLRPGPSQPNRGPTRSITRRSARQTTARLVTTARLTAARHDDSSADDSSADDSSVDDDNVADSRTDHSGWDSIDASNRPALDALRVSPERRVHILDGDADGGGGHRHGIGNPGKTEFPASWNDEKIIDALLDVARRPDHSPGHQEWNDRWVARGTRDDVEVVAVIARDGRIWTGWPTPGGPGVVKNPKEL